MRRLFASIILTCALGRGAEAAVSAMPPFGPQDRILVLAPHPDDETIACGGVIQTAGAMGLPIRVVFLTHGDNNQWSFAVYRKHLVLSPRAIRAMGEVRHAEAQAAAAALGLPPGGLTFLGYPDFRTLEIWTRHWGTGEPACRGMLNRSTAVPYEDAFRPGAPYKGEEIVRDLTAIVRDFKPTRIFVSHPADHNPDHQALYLFTRLALWTLQGQPMPVVQPYLVHSPGWPSPEGYHPEATNGLPAGLRERADWQELLLTPGETACKYRALEAHRTQLLASENYLLSFVRANEWFGDFPDIRLRLSGNAVSPVDAARGESGLSALLTDEEQARFVGIEERSIGIEAGALVISHHYSRPLSEMVTFSVCAFGYRDDRPFDEMPKLQIRLDAVRHRITDQGEAVPDTVCTVRRSPREIEVRIPLSALGNPQRVFTSSRTYAAEVPLDSVAWRVLVLDAD